MTALEIREIRKQREENARTIKELKTKAETARAEWERIPALERIKYIEINKKTQIITPTNKGEIIYDIVNFSMPDMLNPKLTASWEKGLDMVAKKEIEPQVFMDKLENYIKCKFDKLVVKM